MDAPSSTYLVYYFMGIGLGAVGFILAAFVVEPKRHDGCWL